MCIGGYLWGRCCDDVPIYRPPRPNPGIIRPPHPKPKPTTPPKPVPLTGVIVSAKLVDFCAEVTIQQRYENIEDVPVEATYVFPLEEKASVCNFFAIVDGKKVEGKIKEKQKAKDDYDDAIASGHSAYLLEEVEDKKNTFKTSIGNLPPKKEVVITIVYVTELQFSEDKKLEFVLPTNTKAYPDGIVNPRFLTPTVKENAQSIPYGLKVDINLEMTSRIKSVTSPTHPIEFQPGDVNTQAQVILANQQDTGVPLVKNFELLVLLAEPNKPVLRVQDNVGMLALYPDLNVDDEDPITEMIFIVDRSGSMSGTKMQKTKDTMQIFLRSLPLGTLFNIVGFGSNYVPLFKEGSKEYEDGTLAQATQYVNDMKANLGGTSLLPPLKSVLSTTPREGIPRQIFVLTDGEVDNTQDCIDYVRQHSNTTRVFAFGIYGASPVLVNGLAKAGEGKAELILGNENLETKVLAQLKRALQPALTDLKIDWGELKAQQTPYVLPPLFSGSRVITYGYLAPDAKPGKVVFSAQSVKGPYRFELDVDPSHPFPGNFIPKLAARSMIRDLEEGRSAHGKISEKETKEKIIPLSIKSGMLSKYTAFIAVHENDEAVEATMETRDVNQLEQQHQQVKMQKSGSATTSSVTGGSYIKRGRPTKNLVHLPQSAAAPSLRSSNVGGRGGSRSGSAAPTSSLDGLRMSLSSSRTAAPSSSSSSWSSGSEDDDDYDSAPIEKSKKKEKKESGFGGGRKGAVPIAPAPGKPQTKSFSLFKRTSTSSTSASADRSDGGSWKAQEEKEEERSRDRRASPRSNYSAPPPPPAAAAAPELLNLMSIDDSFSAPPMQAPAAPSRSFSLASNTSTATSSSSGPGSSGGVRDIVMKQKAAGNFLEDALQFVGGSLDKLRANAPAPLKDLPATVLDQILITAFICGVLHKKYASDEGQWELVEKKALAWMKKEWKKAGKTDDFDWKAIQAFTKEWATKEEEKQYPLGSKIDSWGAHVRVFM